MTSSSSANSEWKNRLTSLQDLGLERRMRHCEGATGAKVTMDGQSKHLFCSNDYLGLANHPRIAQAMVDGVARWGTGAGASRLVSGNLGIHDALEKAAADFVQKARALFFVSGYQANLGAISALVGRGDVIFSDALVHASLIDGARLSRADIQIYRHSDIDHLSQLLHAAKGYRLKLIVTDSVFSMDGDVAKLNEIVTLARQHHAAIYLDEAHALGAFGPEGKGIAATLGLTEEIDVLVATFSKALGVAGAFVATNDSAASLIKSTARSLLYTTAAAPPVAAAALESIAVVKGAENRRRRLRENIEIFKRAARRAGLPTLPSSTAIQPIMTGDNRRTMAVSTMLFDKGFFVQGIRPPTVPEGKGRLRVTLSASHDEEAIQSLASAIQATLKETPA